MAFLYFVLAAVAVAFALDVFNRRRIRNLQQSGVYPPPGHGGAHDVERLIALGQNLDAIKLYRQIHRTDLKTAKKLSMNSLTERTFADDRGLSAMEGIFVAERAAYGVRMGQPRMGGVHRVLYLLGLGGRDTRSQHLVARTNYRRLWLTPSRSLSVQR
jgi:hypothetical protein